MRLPISPPRHYVFVLFQLTSTRLVYHNLFSMSTLFLKFFNIFLFSYFYNFFNIIDLMQGLSHKVNKITKIINFIYFTMFIKSIKIVFLDFKKYTIFMLVKLFLTYKTSSLVLFSQLSYYFQCFFIIWMLSNFWNIFHVFYNTVFVNNNSSS